jgi:hypothetical protein
MVRTTQFVTMSDLQAAFAEFAKTMRNDVVAITDAQKALADDNARIAENPSNKAASAKVNVQPETLLAPEKTRQAELLAHMQKRVAEKKASANMPSSTPATLPGGLDKNAMAVVKAYESLNDAPNAPRITPESVEASIQRAKSNAPITPAKVTSTFTDSKTGATFTVTLNADMSLTIRTEPGFLTSEGIRINGKRPFDVLGQTPFRQWVPIGDSGIAFQLGILRTAK